MWLYSGVFVSLSVCVCLCVRAIPALRHRRLANEQRPVAALTPCEAREDEEAQGV